MKNPWTAKNPFMSMWLSGAHKAANAARGQAAAAVKREANKAARDAMTAGTRQVLDFWSAALGGGPGTKHRTKKRR